MDATILVVDDDEDVLAYIVPTLQRAGYQQIITAADGDEALYKWENESPDLIVLDIEMPGTDGYGVLRQIRRTDKTVPIIMLTARNQTFEEQIAIERGANYWVTKSQRQLLLTYMKAALEDVHADSMKFNWLQIDFKSMQVKVRRADKWVKVHLAPRERDLLFFLARRKGIVQPARRLMEKVFEVFEGIDVDGMHEKVQADVEAGKITQDQADVRLDIETLKEDIIMEFKGLQKTVATLREKIETKENEHSYIVTVTGEGYYFNPDN